MKVFAQENSVEGIVFDKDTKDRVAHVNILNTRTSKSFYNDLKGEFKIEARQGDKLVISKQDYLPDTVTVKSNANIAVYLQRFAIPLKEVSIRDSLATPQSRLAATKREYSKAYGSAAYSDPFGVVPGGGAGISIDALYNSISKSGRNAEHLRGLIQGDFEQNVIDYRFNRSYVGNVTGLKDRELTDFMLRYRPGYYMVTTATEYEFITYIRNNLRRYKRNKRALSTPPLIKPAKGGEPD
ncbi:MAG TPA: hypothetical protein VK668_20420 [Mucilaginibacter sp.]|nr:hypothetical protein [Mucilaginibacter sp.]